MRGKEPKTLLRDEAQPRRVFRSGLKTGASFKLNTTIKLNRYGNRNIELDSKRRRVDLLQ